MSDWSKFQQSPQVSAPVHRPAATMQEAWASTPPAPWPAAPAPTPTVWPQAQTYADPSLTKPATTAWPLSSDIPIAQTPAIPQTLSEETKIILASHGGDVKNVIAAWESSAETLEIIKAREAKLRIAVAQLKFPTPERGVNNLPLANGYTLKLTHKLNYTLEDDIAKVEAVLDQVDACGNEGKFLGERIITWKPTFHLSEYEKLDMESPIHRQVKTLIDTVLTSKPGMPALEITAPKDKKKK